MTPRRITVFTAAPISVGSEVVVETYRFDDPTEGDTAMRVRDVNTHILYAGSRGDSDWTGAAPPVGTTLIESFRGRVQECVISNVRQPRSEGWAPQTVLMVEAFTAVPYR